MNFYTIKINKKSISLIDQRKLPLKENYLTLTSYESVARAIENMTVRGAPAIGVTAAAGIYLGIFKSKATSILSLEKDFKKICKRFAQTRPTAVNLFWAIEKMQDCFESNRSFSISKIKNVLYVKAQQILEEDIKVNKKMGKRGSVLLKNGDTVLTHCNAGALATAGYGTALGVIRAAVESGKKINVIADETRPLLQGARLTAWELAKDGINVELITDNMAGYLMSLGKIDKVIVGADRIASNGDAANKIGTYSVALLAKMHRIPFYVAAPVSTIDFNIKSGLEIEIEERAAKEVQEIFGKKITPTNMRVLNPAFDVTPAKYITAIITEQGILNYPYVSKIKKLNR